MKIKHFNSYYLIATILVIFIVVPIVLYYANFHDNEISKNSSDWANFSTYISGIVTPIATIISVFVLLKVNETVKHSNFNIFDRYRQIKLKSRNMYFPIQLPKDLSFDKRIQDLNNRLDALESFIEGTFDSDEDLKKEITELCLKNCINQNIINDMFFKYNGFESRCLAIPNLLKEIGAYIILLKISHYKELAKVDNKTNYDEKLKTLSDQLEIYLKDHQLSD